MNDYDTDGYYASYEAPDMERTAGNEPLETRTSTPFDSPVCITVVSYRTRLADSDGVSAKAAIDGLVQAGIIKDDSPKYVEEVRYKQIKVKNKSEEKTELIIETV